MNLAHRDVESGAFGTGGQVEAQSDNHNHTSGDTEIVVDFSIGSHYRFIELIGTAVDNLTQLAGFEPEDAHWIGLAVRESVVNAIKHGNRLDESKSVEARLKLATEWLVISIRDRGTGFDASKVADPLDPENILNPNGRGIFYMRTFMDEVVFSAHPQGGTEVRMSKRIPVKGEDESAEAAD